MDISFEAVLDPDLAPPAEPVVLETLPVLAPFDTQPVSVQVQRFAEQIRLLKEEAEKILVITDQATAERATELGVLAKKLTKELTNLKKYYERPHTEYVNTLRNIFKVFLDPCEFVPRFLSPKLSAWRTFQDNERRRRIAEQEALVKKQQEEEAKKAQESADKGAAYTPVTPAPVVVPEVPKTTRTSGGSSSQRKEWTFEITDPDLVPLKYRPINETLIRKDVRGGLREIPGVRVYQDYITGFRT